MFINQGEEDELTARLARHFEYVDELLKDVGAGAHSQDARALERAILLPLLDATLAEELATIVTLHGLSQD